MGSDWLVSYLTEFALTDEAKAIRLPPHLLPAL